MTHPHLEVGAGDDAHLDPARPGVPDDVAERFLDYGQDVGADRIAAALA